MKKTISINIQGVLFHIEEDGYHILKNYLDSISSYFSGYEDAHEITKDIEVRIAEKLERSIGSRIEVVTAQHIEELIRVMGTVNDFKKGEEHTVPLDEAKQHTETNDTEHKATEEVKKLRRDLVTKKIGGVASGIGNYLGIDSIWIRLIFLLAVVVDSITLIHNNFRINIGGFIIIGYVISWMIIPGDYPEKSIKGKKLFRSSSDRSLGGVAGGLAKYFGIDVLAVRVGFILSLFFGFGLLVYIILWIITPLARSLTDEMQMEGESLTLSNIETNVKKNSI